MILHIEEVSKRFGGLKVLDKVNLDIAENELVGLIGPNGAGKTTLFNVIGGFNHADHGKIIFNDRDISRFKPHQVANLGIRRSFQGALVFRKLSVFDNVYTAFHMAYQTKILARLMRLPCALEEERIFKERTLEILEYVGLTPHKDKLAVHLSSGLLRLLAIAMTLTTNPKLLLLDEPVTTLSPDKVEMVMNLITKIRKSGTTIILIEHNMKAIMNYCDRIVVLGYGKILASGCAQDIRDNPLVIESYLGTKQ
jgi:branched-chain amino acid transport system ATP-binding protein